MASYLFSVLALGFFLVAWWASEAGSMWIAAVCAVFGLVGLVNLMMLLSAAGG